MESRSKFNSKLFYYWPLIPLTIHFFWHPEYFRIYATNIVVLPALIVSLLLYGLGIFLSTRFKEELAKKLIMVFFGLPLFVLPALMPGLTSVVSGY